jgi:predicted transcriptional regulator of viral defense system
MANSPKSDASSIASFAENLQASGRYTFTRTALEKAEPRSQVAIKSALRRLKERGRIVSPRRGFYVVVPAEYRAAGCPPASWFINDLMAFLHQPYYVGILSAAAIHGAAHQQPMIFQVVTDRPTRPISVARVRIEFHMSRSVEQAPIKNVQTETGSMRVGSPEVTAFDLVRFAEAAGYLNNVATVLSELAEKIDAHALTKLAQDVATPDVQRLGYLLELVGASSLADSLSNWLRDHRHRSAVLAPWRGAGKEIAPDNKWRVIANETVEADI